MSPHVRIQMLQPIIQSLPVFFLSSNRGFYGTLGKDKLIQRVTRHLEFFCSQ